ncbi:MAG: hemolysin family protein [Bacteroidota bacterium]
MNATILLVLFFLLSIIFSFLCSIWEAVLLSITPSYVQRKVAEGTQTGKLLQTFKKDIDRPLSAILTLNTIAHTVGAIGVGAQAGEVFGDGEGPLGLSYESIVASLMTLAILVLSEIIPKTIGANKWQSLAPFTVRSLNILLLILRPFVWLSQLITRSLKKDKDKSVLSRADYAAMTQVAAASGELDQSETTIINNLLKLEELAVKDIMTPRTVISMVEASTKLMDYYQANDKLRFSRIPVYQERTDNVIGLVLKDDLLLRLVEDEDDLTMESIKRPILAVKDDLPLPTLFETLTQQRSHIAIVVDEYGSLVGLVSMEDVFETLLGLEIMDESDNVPSLQELARQRWEERARNMGMIE